MKIKKERVGSQLILKIKGRIDTLTSREFETEVITLIENGDNNLVGDCSQLDYVSSSALRVFLVALKRLKKNSGQFVLFGLQPQIREVFDISGFLDLFKIYNDRDEALDENDK